MILRLLPPVAALFNLACVAAFVWGTWARGTGVLLGFDFTGPQLARLVRSSDLVIGGPFGGPFAVALVIMLVAVPICAAIAAVLLVGAPLTSRPQTALRAARVISGVAALLCLGTCSLLAVGPEAGDSLARLPGIGAALSLAASLTAGALTTVMLRCA